MHFLDILLPFSLDMGEISSNLLKKVFATWQHAFLSTSIMFYDIFCLGMHRNQNLVVFSAFQFSKFFFAFPFLNLENIVFSKV